jgi:molecular chaperone DnaK (HSP70)
MQGLSVSDIVIILVGGSFSYARIADKWRKFFGKKKASKELTLMKLLQLEQLFKVEFFLEM